MSKKTKDTPEMRNLAKTIASYQTMVNKFPSNQLFKNRLSDL